ncbi:MAG: hypothetical protein SFW36_21490 [Leptolyngbyaceae cyanobacterium bins.59]|nr:hypothetical protein [Leptolyngbyaceae cyanobacterium bins.59]
MNTKTYYFVFDSEGFYPKGDWDSATAFALEENAQSIAQSHGGQILELHFLEGPDGSMTLDPESEDKVLALEEDWDQPIDLAEANLDF